MRQEAALSYWMPGAGLHPLPRAAQSHLIFCLQPGRLESPARPGLAFRTDSEGWGCAGVGACQHLSDGVVIGVGRGGTGRRWANQNARTSGVDRVAGCGIAGGGACARVI